jgi:hypothetical protein
VFPLIVRSTVTPVLVLVEKVVGEGVRIGLDRGATIVVLDVFAGVGVEVAPVAVVESGENIGKDVLFGMGISVGVGEVVIVGDGLGEGSELGDVVGVGVDGGVVLGEGAGLGKRVGIGVL